MRGLAWPNRFTHHELTASIYRLLSKSSSHTPSPRLTGISGRVSWSFIWVQGCHTDLRSRATRSALRMVVSCQAAEAVNKYPDATCYLAVSSLNSSLL